MGQHKHVRVCVNGQKCHSSGGIACEYIKKYTEMFLNHEIPMTRIALWGEYKSRLEPDDLCVLLFIRRHRNHNIRTIEHAFIGMGEHGSLIPIHQRFDLRKRADAVAYDNFQNEVIDRKS